MADQGSEGLLSPFLRERRLDVARKHLRGRILDVGCGSGGLAQFVSTENYLGIDIDGVSIERARHSFPEHRFAQQGSTDEGGFDTIVALAVIEHVPNPSSFLRLLKKNLSCRDSACIICTTPHPSMEALYLFGVKIGLFSSSAHEEHENLLDRDALANAGRDAGLQLCHYRRFLLGANQIAVYGRGEQI